MVDIMLGGGIVPVPNNEKQRENKSRRTLKKKPAKDRRKARKDRRKDVRSGVVVTLSKYPDRRSGTDRRKKA